MSLTAAIVTTTIPPTTTTAAIVEETPMRHWEALFIIITLLTFVLNLYVIVIIATNKKLHVPVNMFIVSICCVGILLTLVDMPFQLIYMDGNYSWHFGLEVCILWYVFDLSTCTISLLNFMVIAFIRYCAIVKPQGPWAPKKVQILVLCLVWIVPFVAWTISLNILFRENPPEGFDCYLSISMYYSISADVFAFLIPLVLLISINVKLMWELRKRTKKVIGTGGTATAIKKSPTIQVISVQPAESVIGGENSVSTTANTNAGKPIIAKSTPQTTTRAAQQSKNSSSPLKKEKKAILALIILQIGFLVCWLPFICSFPLDSLSLEVNSDLNNMIYWVAYMNSLFNAIVLICTSDNYQVLCRKSTYETLKKKLRNCKERY